MATAHSAFSLDTRLRDRFPSVKLVYLVLRNDGPLTKGELVDRTALTHETVRVAVAELEETLGKEFDQGRDPEDLRSVVCDIEATERHHRTRREREHPVDTPLQLLTTAGGEQLLATMWNWTGREVSIRC